MPHTPEVSKQADKDVGHNTTPTQTRLAMLLAMASHSGLLAAMINDSSHKTAEEWSCLVNASLHATRERLHALADAKVVEQIVADDGVKRFRIYADRAMPAQEMGAIFEMLLSRYRSKVDEQGLMRLVKFRFDRMLAPTSNPIGNIGVTT